MSLISQSIAAMFNGVSQQPATIRLPSQGEAQVNAYSTPADGLRKRPPLTHVSKLTAADRASAHVHTINRDTEQRYIVVVTDGDIEVYDEDGNAQPVNFPNGKAYLDVPAGTAAEAFALVTVADYTFIVNKTVVVQMDAVGSDLSLAAGWADYYSPTSWFTAASGPADIRYYNSPRTFRGTKQTFSDLPAASTNPIEGDLWKITGADEGFGSYYVRRTGGVWEESAPAGLEHKFDDDTMPWALVREADNEFHFRPFKWNVRKVGDDETNPPPAFVRKRINDVLFYRNRLALISDEHVIFSASGDYGQFWRSTATDTLDSDAIDVAMSANNVALIKYGVPFENSLMLFSDQTQFRLNAEPTLTPRTVSADVVTNYATNIKARPVAIGSDVYFVTESGTFSRVREYFVDDDTLTPDATDVTAHVPRYLPKGVFKMAGNSNEDALFVLSEAPGMRNRVYVYKFHWDGDDKVQSAWSYWEHGDTNSVILSVDVIESVLYLVVQRADGLYLERCTVQSGQATGNLDFEVLLDRLCVLTGDYDDQNDQTTFTLPYPVLTAQQPGYQLVTGVDFEDREGSLIDPSQYEWVSTTSVRVPGDHSAGDVYGGLKYTLRYRFSEVFVQGREGAVTTGRFQLRTWVIYYTDTAYFKTVVAPYGTDPNVETVVPSSMSEFTGKTIGSSSLVIGRPIFATGTYAFQIYGNSREAWVELQNDSHVQSVFQAAEYEGLYHNRAAAR
jgi:hypothetical protein